jgi:prephenate dehydrogenase
MIDARAGEGAVFTPPSFQAIARTIEAVRSDAGHLFLAIQRENPYAGSARRRLLDALSNVDEQLRAMRDVPGETASASASASVAAPLAIPDLGASSPDLRATRDLIDALDRDLVDLLARRRELSRRAGRAKARAGKEVRDETRERAMLEDRAEWGRERGLDPDALRDVFDSILRLSRAAQREKS